MLVWVNGAFGSGKTRTANELARRWPGARLFDPEQIGFMLRRVIAPEHQTGDFQDLALWRRFTVDTAVYLLRLDRQPLIVPMALVDRRYFGEVMGGLDQAGIEVHHFSLLVSPAILRRRLRRRWALPRSRKWALAQVEHQAQALAGAEFARHIAADGRRPGEVVDEILAALPRRPGAA